MIVKSTALLLNDPEAGSPVAVDPQLLRLKQVVLASLQAANSKRNYGKALDHLFVFAASRPLTRDLLLEWRASMEQQSFQTVNIRLSAMRSLVNEARRAGMLSSEAAAQLTDIPNIKQAGARKGNWLTREQVKEILAVPDRSKLKGKRDYVILTLLVACALRRTELAELEVTTIQQREGRWVLADLEGKGRRIRTVAIPIWVKNGIDAWTAAANIKVKS
jgi:site-specific recombinase XerD